MLNFHLSVIGISVLIARMGGVSRERALWLSQHVLPHEPALRAWLMTKRVSDLDPDDIVQESYAKLAALESVDNIRNPRRYFFQTAYSVLITHIRRSRVIPMRAMGDIELLDIPTDEPSPEQQVQDSQQLRALMDAIASLPTSCRDVFILRRVHGLSQRAVAQKLRLSENTVEHHMTRSIRLLMDLFYRGGKPGSQASISKEASVSTGYGRFGNKHRDR
jgi:RNA polymerase sigma-70 factor (ECF subfamily)